MFWYVYFFGNKPVYDTQDDFNVLRKMSFAFATNPHFFDCNTYEKACPFLFATIRRFKLAFILSLRICSNKPYVDRQVLHIRSASEIGDGWSFRDILDILGEKTCVLGFTIYRDQYI